MSFSSTSGVVPVCRVRERTMLRILTRERTVTLIVYSLANRAFFIGTLGWNRTNVLTVMSRLL